MRNAVGDLGICMCFVAARGMRNAECGRRGVAKWVCGMRNVECGRSGVAEWVCGMRNAECGRSGVAEWVCGMRNAECGWTGVWSAVKKVYSAVNCNYSISYI